MQKMGYLNMGDCNYADVRFFTGKPVQNDRIKPGCVILSESEVSHKLAGSVLLLRVGDSSHLRCLE